MGNCLVHEEKLVREMKTDGKIVEYKHPIKVHQVLSEFPHHAVQNTVLVTKHMHPEDEMLPHRLYNLLPLPAVLPQPIKMTKKKAVRVSGDDGGRASGVKRIKLVISKTELQRLLTKGEVKVQRENSTKAAGSYDRDGEVISKGWFPALECIPEIN